MNAPDDNNEDAAAPGRSARPAETQRRLTIIGNRLDSRELFVGTRDIVIVHGRDAYHLRLTGQNKLILTK